MRKTKTQKATSSPPKWQDRARRAPTQDRSLKTIDAIFKAAIDLLRVNDEEKFSTNKVAQQAGISIGTVYQYFATKEDIVWGLAQRAQVQVWERIDRYLATIESSASLRDVDAKIIITGLIQILVESYAKGRSDSSDMAASRRIIRYAWKCENIDEMAKFSAELTVRIKIFIENINHPQLPPRSSSQYFVITRAVLGVLRYASLERTSLLHTNALEESLGLMFLGLFDNPHTGADADAARSGIPNEKDTLVKESDINEQVELFEYVEQNLPPSLRMKIVQRRSKNTIGIIFKSLMDMLGKEDSASVTINKIAIHSGFSIGAIYKYFPNKEKLLWMALVYGSFFLQNKVDNYLRELEDQKYLTRQSDPRIAMIETTRIYVNAFCKNGGFVGSEYFSAKLVRLAWLCEHQEDTIFLAQQTDNRMLAYWERVQHPQMPNGIPYQHLYVASRGVISVFRSASLESPALLDNSAMASALLHISVTMGASQVRDATWSSARC